MTTKGVKLYNLSADAVTPERNDGMNEYLQYAYVFVWGILAVLTFIIGTRQGVYAFVLSAFFVFMTVWYALNSFGGIPMFEGTLGIVFKCISLAFLAIVVFMFYLSKKKRREQSDAEAAESNETDED